MVHSAVLNAVWPEMTGRKTQRVATDEPDMLSRHFRLTGCEQRVTTARQQDGGRPRVCHEGLKRPNA